MPRAIFLATTLAFFVLGCQPSEAPLPSVQGAWQPERYLLKDGSEVVVTGRLFFAEKDWTVLFFVLDTQGHPTRGSGEGGTYTLRDDSLTFTHLYHLSSGQATDSLPESPMRMEIHDAAQAADEPCTIDLDADRLTIHFPSGNAMTFRRRSADST